MLLQWCCYQYLQILCYLLINIILLPNLCCSPRLWFCPWIFNLGNNWYQIWDNFHGLFSEWPWGTWSIDRLSLKPQESGNQISLATQQKKRKVNKEPSLSCKPRPVSWHLFAMLPSGCLQIYFFFTQVRFSCSYIYVVYAIPSKSYYNTTR